MEAQRAATQVDNVWTFFIYDAMGKMVAEYGGVPAIDEGGIKYVLQDWQGSSRAVLSNTGVVQARMDYTAFGEEIQSGVGQRTTSQGFNANNNLNQKYALTERDKASGLDHTWFRKNENKAGRWTSPDPYNGSMSLGNPQSFNRYSYVENQPTNFIDPSGLLLAIPIYHCERVVINDRWVTVCEISGYWFVNDNPGGGSTGGTEPGGGTGGEEPTKPTKSQCDAIKELLRREGQYGTNTAAYMSAEETGKNVSDGKGGTTRLTSLRNEFNGILWVGDAPLDADWLLTLNATRLKAGKDKALGGQVLAYGIGKTIWSVGKLITGQSVQNPIPFWERAERNAAWYAEGGYKFKEIFTPDWLKENCPE